MSSMNINPQNSVDLYTFDRIGFFYWVKFSMDRAGWAYSSD